MQQDTRTMDCWKHRMLDVLMLDPHITSIANHHPREIETRLLGNVWAAMQERYREHEALGVQSDIRGGGQVMIARKSQTHEEGFMPRIYIMS